MDLLQRLLDHDHWATVTLFDTCATLTDAQFGQTFDVGHESIHETFAHIISNIAYWTDSIEGRPFDRSDQDWSRGRLRERYEQTFAEFALVAKAKQDADAMDEVFIDSWDAPQTNGAAILHVILHDDEHRQEILHILNRLDIGEVPEIDHALWDFVRRGLFQPD